MTAEVAHADAAAGLDRRALDGWAAVCEFVREGLLCAGIDPARAGALRFAPPSANDDRGTAEEFVIKDADGLAGMFGFTTRQFFEVESPADRENVQVKF